MERGGGGTGIEMQLMCEGIELFCGDPFLGHAAGLVEDFGRQAAGVAYPFNLLVVFDDDLIFLEIEGSGVIAAFRRVGSFLRIVAEFPFFSAAAPAGIISIDHSKIKLISIEYKANAILVQTQLAT